MTREEAKTYLDVIWNRYRAEYEIEKETMEAYHMAIEALSEQTKLFREAYEQGKYDAQAEALDRQKGEWVYKESSEYEPFSITDMKCSVCGKYASIVLPHGTTCVYD